MLKILHTSDWHLGKKLFKRERHEEQEERRIDRLPSVVLTLEHESRQFRLHPKLTLTGGDSVLELAD